MLKVQLTDPGYLPKASQLPRDHPLLHSLNNKSIKTKSENYSSSCDAFDRKNLAHNYPSPHLNHTPESEEDRLFMAQKYLDLVSVPTDSVPQFGNPHYQCENDETRIEQMNDKCFCSLCQIYTGENVAHCYECNCCVEGYDHHCGFLNCCIGQRNLFVFLIFLFHTTGSAFYFTTASIVLMISNKKVNFLLMICAICCSAIGIAFGFVSLGFFNDSILQKWHIRKSIQSVKENNERQTFFSFMKSLIFPIPSYFDGSLAAHPSCWIVDCSRNIQSAPKKKCNFR